MWHDRLPPKLARRTAAAIRKSSEFLKETQDSDGAWTPLWFGSQLREDGANPVLGTARVIPALRAAQNFGCDVATVLARAEEFLRAMQAPDGGWGAGREMAPTVEETALVVTALVDGDGEARAAALRGADWLAARVLAGPCPPAPLGLYFARLWYGERLYPLVWAIEALGLATRA
jgi:squalene-hopene/tetraprenyl-beta-curcumene cyclase